jgi:hypothetical protein
LTIVVSSMKLFPAALTAATIWLILAPVAHAADDCPTAVTGRGAFIVERGEQSKTEVVFGDGAVVGATFRYRGKAYLETRQYEGLIQLDRVDKGHRTVFKPNGDLAKLFPLKPKQQISVQLEAREDGAESIVTTVSLKMTGVDSLAIGACKYDVLKFERIETRSNRKTDPIVEYYAPELKFVVAKEYRERDGRTTLIKFDRIYSADR